MKKALLLILSLFMSFSMFSQDGEIKQKQHELKANAFNLILFKSADVSYEYLIDSESSVGASVLINLRSENSNEDVYYREKFALTPFYRRYFSSKYAWGFFLEAFGMYNVQSDNNDVYDTNSNSYVDSDDTSNNLAFGMAVGGKFVSKKGFAFEIFGGIGRNIIMSDDLVGTEFVPRLGASFGYRF